MELKVFPQSRMSIALLWLQALVPFGWQLKRPHALYYLKEALVGLAGPSIATELSRSVPVAVSCGVDFKNDRSPHQGNNHCK